VDDTAEVAHASKVSAGVALLCVFDEMDIAAPFPSSRKHAFGARHGAIGGSGTTWNVWDPTVPQG
jgi:hypothetical protein